MLKVEIHTRAGSDDITPATFVFPGALVPVFRDGVMTSKTTLAEVRARLVACGRALTLT